MQFCTFLMIRANSKVNVLRGLTRELVEICVKQAHFLGCSKNMDEVGQRRRSNRNSKIASSKRSSGSIDSS